MTEITGPSVRDTGIVGPGGGFVREQRRHGELRERQGVYHSLRLLQS